MNLSAKEKGTLAVLALIALAGVGCWIYQLAGGLGVTGMSNVNSWGAYICMFMLFVGLSAGGLIVASSAHVFRIESFKPIAKPAVILSTVCICIAAALILIDLGGIQRVWRLFTGPNFRSPLIWDVCIITLYLVINVLDLVWMSRGQEDKVRKLSYVALPVAILVHSVTAWIFGLQISREGWHSAIMAPIFVASALDSGLALLLLSLIGLRAARIVELSRELMASLARLLVVFICIDAFFIGCEILTEAYSGTAAGTAVLSQMFSGATSPFFWFEVVCGIVIPVAILCIPANRDKTALVALASALVVLGVACKRIWLLFTSFIPVNVFGGPGVTLGTRTAVDEPVFENVWSTFGFYAPTLPEAVIVCGVVCAGVIAFFLLARKLCK